MYWSKPLQKVTKTQRGLHYIMYYKRLREQGLLIHKHRRWNKALISVYSCLVECYKEGGARPFAEIYTFRTRDEDRSWNTGNSNWILGKPLLSSGGQTLQVGQLIPQVVEFSWRYSKPHLTQTWTRSRWPCFSSGVGLDDLQRFLATSAVLWSEASHSLSLSRHHKVKSGPGQDWW